MGSIGLRTADKADADAIRALTREAYAKWTPLIGREPLPMKVDYLDALTRHRFDLLYLDGDLAGLIETTPDGEWLLIENLAVRPALQGRGLGKGLLRFAEQMAAAAGLTGVRLYTNKLFAENLRLYTAFGYAVDREEPYLGGVTVHMTKRL